MSKNNSSAKSLQAPNSWRSPPTHLEKVLTDPWYTAVAQLLDCVQRATHRFYGDAGLFAAALPVTTGAISSPMGLGSDSLPVSVELMGVRTYLADSAQFMLEILCRTVGGVYYIMPSFRGEATDDTHLAQFYHSEIEIHGGLDDVIALSERYVRSLAETLLDEHSELVGRIAGTTSHLELLLAHSGAFPRLRHDEALLDLNDDLLWTSTLGGGVKAITRAGEAELARRHGIDGSILWLTHFDATSVPFYQAGEEGTCAALNADLIMGGRETIGAGERHFTGAQVLAALKSHGIEQAPYSWYLDMRDLRPMRTSGMGMGVERFLMWATGTNDIRNFMLLLRENGVAHLP